MMLVSNIFQMRYGLLLVCELCVLNFLHIDAFTSLTDTGCGVSKSCFRSPTSCSSASSCKYFVSWKKVTDTGKDYLEMEVGGTLTTTGGFMAIGFSADKLMGTDGVTVCYTSGSSILFLSGFNTGQSAPTMVTPAADYLKTSGGTPALGGSYTSASKYIQCRFRRLITPANNNLINLSSGNFYILVAEGAMSGTTLQYHNANRWVSPAAYDVSKITAESSGGAGVSLSQTFTAVTTDSCGRDKSCFRIKDDAAAFVSWRPVGNAIEIEMWGKISGANGYIAIGFSEDAKMNNDGVLACVASSTGKVSAHVAYNPTSQRSNVYVSGYPNDFLVSSVAGNLLGGSYKASDSTISCRLRRLAKPSTKVSELKDLSSPLKYYIMIARGGGSSSTGLDKHPSSMAKVSGIPVDVSSTNFVGDIQNKIYYLAKLHGAFMIIAWMVCTGIGMIIARHCKPLWPDKKLCGVGAWFQLHRSLEITCLILTVLAFILIFVEAGGYSSVTSLPQAAHPVMGIIVTIMCIVNPFMAIFRCSPDSPRRYIFNWAHRIVAFIASVLSYPTIIIGFGMAKSGLSSMIAPWGIAIAAAVFYLVMEIMFIVVDEMKENNDAPEEHSDMNASNSHGSSMGIQEQNTRPSKKLKIKKILLFIVVAGTSIFSLILIVCIAALR